MNPPAGNMVVLCVRVFLVWAFLFVALGEAEASDASEQEALSTSSASVKATDEASTQELKVNISEICVTDGPMACTKK